MTQVDDQPDVEAALRGSLSAWSMAPGDVHEALAAATGQAKRAHRRRILAVGSGATLTAAALIASIGLSQAGPSHPTSLGSLRGSMTSGLQAPVDANPVSKPDRDEHDPPAPTGPDQAYEMKATFAPGTYGGFAWRADGEQMGEDQRPLLRGTSCQAFSGPDPIASIVQTDSELTKRGVWGKIAGFKTGTGNQLIPALKADKLACRWTSDGSWPKPLPWAGHQDADHFLGEIPLGEIPPSTPIGQVAVLAAARVGDLLILGVGYDLTKSAAQSSATALVLATEQRVRASDYPPAHGLPVPGSENEHVPDRSPVTGPSDEDNAGPAVSALPPTLLPRGSQLPSGYTYSVSKDGWKRSTTSEAKPYRLSSIAGTTDGKGWKNPPKGEATVLLGVGDLAYDVDISERPATSDYSIVRAAPGQAEQLLRENIAGTGSRGYYGTVARQPWPGGGVGTTHFLATVTEPPLEGQKIRPSYVAAQVVGDYVASVQSYVSPQEAVDGVNAMVANLRTAGRVK